MRSIAFGVVVMLSVVCLSCEDPLPSYVAPTDFLRASVRNISQPDVYYSYVEFFNDLDQNSVTVSTAAQTIFIDVVNTFDETLQDIPEVSGMLTIQETDIPDMKATIPLTVSSLTGPQYNTTTKILTLNPGDTLKLRCSWRYKSDDGKWVFGRANVASDSDLHGNSYDRTHTPMKFSAVATVKLFASTNTFISQKKEFQLLFHGHISLPP